MLQQRSSPRQGNGRATAEGVVEHHCHLFTVCLVCVCLCGQLAFKFVPSREAFLANLGDGPGLMAEMKAFIDAFSEVLAEVHKFLVGAGVGP